MRTIHILIIMGLLAALVPTGQAERHTSGHELPPTVYEAAGNDIPPQAMDYHKDIRSGSGDDVSSLQGSTVTALLILVLVAAVVFAIARFGP